MIIDNRRRAHEKKNTIISKSCFHMFYLCFLNTTKVYVSVVILMLAEWEEDKKSHWLDPVSRREQPYMN